MSAPTLRLITAYRRQESAYQRVLELACSGLAAARAGGSLADLQDINRAKERALAEVSRIDAEIEAEREQWRQSQAFAPETAELEQLLARIGSLIERILAEERETDRWIANGAVCPESGAVQS